MDITDVMEVSEKLTGNKPSFTFHCDTEESVIDDMRVYSFRGKEKLSEPFEFKVELVSPFSNVDYRNYLARNAVLTIKDSYLSKRIVNGVISEFSQGHTGNVFTHYHVTIVPRFWFLSQTCNHQIYQNITVSEIIEVILGKYMFTHETFKLLLNDEYSKREYCVQYGESDLHFISRLCEEEAIYYYFEHTEEGHVLCFSDRPAHTPIPGKSKLRYHPGSGTAADRATIHRWNSNHRVNSDVAELRDWNFTTPSINLGLREKETDVEKATVPNYMNLEIYQFPHLYQTQKDGAKYLELQLQRQTVFRRWAEASGNVSRLTPGHILEVFDLPREEDNRGWSVYSVEHAGEQPMVLEHEAPSDRGKEYTSKALLLPDDLRFIPEMRHKKVRIEGVQSARVVGPGGEEVFTDGYGRVKVKFHWDRRQKMQDTTCWVRVADTWAGQNFGSIRVPRVGHEVLVEFMEGDPDRPVITGRVYNRGAMPPWDLPAQKTLSGIQSREFSGMGRNQLVMDDTTGQLQTQLGSDHLSSQLSLGRITRIEHINGRKETRGDGFELRTDGWGVSRAAKGMLITTYLRAKAKNHVTDLSETADLLQGAAEQHEKTTDLAIEHFAQDGEPTVPGELHEQVGFIKGTGNNDELKTPQVVISSPVGLAMTTEGPAHIHSESESAVTSGKNMSVSAKLNFLVSAMKKVSLFAAKGMKLFTGKGNLEIQAQSGSVDISAKRDITVACQNGKVHISSPKEIILTAGGSYIRINSKGIEQGTRGRWIVYAKARIMAGPKGLHPLKPKFPAIVLELLGITNLVRLVLAAAPGHMPLVNEKYVVTSLGRQIAEGYTTENGEILFEHDPECLSYDIQTVNGENSFRVEMVDDFSEGEKGLKERLAAEGHPAVMEACDSDTEKFGMRLWHDLSEENGESADEGDADNA